jgi:hypothetical protein
MKVRLLRPLNFKKVGTIMDVTDGVGELWIMQRKAARVETAVTEQETATHVETMVPVREVNVSIGRGKGRRSVAV